MVNPNPNLDSTLEAGTRAKLLTAAGEVFAEVGFRDATVREICARAGTNLAAVNYHYRDKLGLYREVMAFAAKEALTKYPAGGTTTAASPAAERLSAFVSNYLRRLFDHGRPAWHGQLICREMIDPTPVLDELTASFIRPQFERLCAIVAELIGAGATAAEVRMGAASVVGQCLFYKHAEAVLKRLEPDWDPTGSGLDELSAHITGFALAGMERMRKKSPASLVLGPGSSTDLQSKVGGTAGTVDGDRRPTQEPHSPGVVLDGGMP